MHRKDMKPQDLYCVEVDDRGSILAVEAGSKAEVPKDLLDLARGFLCGEHSFRGFIWSEADQKTLHQVTLDRTAAGSTVMLTGRKVVDIPYGLTRRELDVLTLMAAGMSNTELASALVLSPRTVSTHADHVLGKIRVSSRTAAAAIAISEGFIRLPFPGDDGGSNRLLQGGDPLGSTAAALPRQAALQPVRKPLVIGAAFPLSGYAAADGLEMAQGTRLAIDEINERGGIHGRSLELEIVDVDILSAESTRSALASLAASEVDVVTSGYFAHQDVAHDFMAELDVPYLHAATMHAMEQRVKDDPHYYGNIFQVCPSDTNYAPRFVEAMTALRDSRQWMPSSRNLMAIQSAWDLTDFGMLEAAAMAEESGWTLTVSEHADESGSSWQTLADTIRRTEPAAVMLGTYVVDGAVDFLKEFLRDSPDTLVYLVFTPSAPEFRKRLGAQADGVLWATVTGTYSDPLGRAFVERYQNRFERPPGRSHAGIAYDRVRVIAQAWSQVADPRNTSAVCSELRQVVHRGVNGVYYFGADGQTTMTYQEQYSDPTLTQAHLVFQIQQGRQRILSPSPYSDARFAPASWLSRTLAAAS